VLDDGSPIPGPRSPWQPDGVNGLSRTLHHGAIDWTDAGFTAPANLGAGPVTVQVDGVRRLAWPPELQTDAGRVHLSPDAVIVLERPG